MPVRWFNCPAGQVEIAGCLEECPLGVRCLTRPTLLEVSKQREWTGKPSTTQLLNGTMMAWLKLTRDYAIDPKSMAFALLGTRHHERLEEQAKKLGLNAELKLEGEITGILDLLEVENGEVILSDHKTYGSFKVVKCLGLEQVTKGIWRRDPGLVDMIDVELQLNNYRVLLEKEHGLKVDRMQVQITVRDGGLWSATRCGVMENIYLLPVKRLDDDEVVGYFAEKAKNLKIALEHGWVERCNIWESWNGRRCTGYCDVSSYCHEVAQW